MVDLYDRDNNPIDWDTLSVLIQDEQYWLVGRTNIADIEVVTMWVGADHWHPLLQKPQRGPLIFATRVSERHLVYMHTTLDQARRRHKMIVNALRRMSGDRAPEGLTGPHRPQSGDVR